MVSSYLCYPSIDPDLSFTKIEAVLVVTVLSNICASLLNSSIFKHLTRYRSLRTGLADVTSTHSLSCHRYDKIHRRHHFLCPSFEHRKSGRFELTQQAQFG